MLGVVRARFLSQGQFVQSVTVLAGGTAIGQVLIVASAPVLTRLYAPVDFGVLTIYVSLLTFLLGVATLRYHMAVPLAPDSETLSALLVLCGMVLVGILAIVSMCVLFFHSQIAAWTNAPRLDQWMWLVPIGFAGAGFIQILTAWAVRNDEFRTLARVRIGQSAGQIGAQLGLGIATQGALGAFGLLAGDVVGRTAGSFGLARMAWRDLHVHFRRVTIRDIRRVARRYRRFPLISSWTGLVASAGSQLPTLLIGAIYGASVVGWFGLCQRLLSMSFVLIASAIGTVFLSRSARLAQSDPDALLELFWATVSRSSVIAVALVGGVSVTAPLLFGPVFGSQWDEAGRYAPVLAIGAGFQFVNRAVGSTSAVVERQDLDFLAELLWAVCASGPLVLAWSIDTTPLTSMVMFSGGVALGSVISIGLSWYALRSAHSRGVRSPRTEPESMEVNAS